METAQSLNRKETASGNLTVMVTGIGAISAAGNDIDANFANMREGKRSPAESPSLFSTDFNKPVFECDSEVLDQNLLPQRRTLALALKALEEALSDATLTQEILQTKKIGVCIGTTVACTLNNLEFYSAVRSGKNPDTKPLERYVNGDISKYISAKLAISGPTATIANACASGTNAIATAHSWIESGRCDIVIAGGADELNLIPYCGFNALQVMSDAPCLPFDRNRSGLNLGEGAGILILESAYSAENRDCKSKISLSSCGGASDAFHLTGPHPEGEGMYSAITAAMSDADVTADKVDYINAHGTATLENDKIEALVFDKLAGGHKLNYSSTKYYTGHTLGAAGAIEAAICVKGMRDGSFPAHPSLHPESGIINPASTSQIPYNGNAVISTSMAFGGSCSALLFKTVSDNSETKDSTNKTPHVTVTNTGIVGPFGRGMKLFTEALKSHSQKTNSPSKSIPDEALKDPEMKRVRRRADKLSIAMLSAAKDAVATVPAEILAETALIAVTGFGAHNTTFKFLDGIIDFGYSAPSPTHFSNSVHNAPSFYITHFLKIKGLSVTFTGIHKPFSEALNYAQELIRSGKYKNVLLVAGDEVGETMLKMSKIWYDSQNRKEPAWGEGAAAFLLSASETGPAQPEKLACRTEINEIFGTTLINDAFEMAANITLNK